MYKDLVQISKAKDIYRTLALMAILSPKPVEHETSKCETGKNSHTTEEQVDISDASATKNIPSDQLGRTDSDVG
jgi:hypothetical protein